MSQAELSHIRNCSPFAAQLLQRYPHWGERLFRPEGDSGEAMDFLHLDIDRFNQELRQTRNLALLRIIHGDLCLGWELQISLEALSRLAETCLKQALEWHHRSLSARHGEPRSANGSAEKMLAVAMGKLGGKELNFSSDIDLILTYPGEGRTPGDKNGARKLSHQQFFTRLARGAIASLSEVTQDGFVYRVDTRLRPYGQAGPLVQSFAALEQYYQQEGRDWERYAWVKARPVAGIDSDRQELMQRIQPFVYRRYVDFTAIEELRSMQARIADAGIPQDLKRGPGGIRQAEFFVQSFQLLRGGRDSRLQTQSFFQALEAINAAGYAEPEATAAILKGYRFLRLMENRIQALHDQQTHILPTEDQDRCALLAAMDATGWNDLMEDLAGHQKQITEIFHGLFRQTAAKPADDWPGWQENPSGSAQRIGTEPDSASAALTRFNQKLDRLALSRRARQRLLAFMPRLFAQLEKKKVSTDVLQELLSFVTAITRRSAYIALLNEKPQAISRIIQLFTTSQWLARQTIQYPASLDTLVDPGFDQTSFNRLALTNQAAAITARQEPDQQLNVLNDMQRGHLFRIAINELSDETSSLEAGQQQALLAEVCLAHILKLAKTAVIARHGELPGLRFCIMAYGSLGARCMEYASDLDLLFIYQADGSPSDGSRPLAPEQYAVRLGQRLVSLLTTLTPAGRLYTVDTRLRPNGQSGLLVTTLDAFAQYQRSEAWVWELQALTRGRAICGDPSLIAAVEDCRRRILCQPRNQAELQTEIGCFRQRMRRQITPKTLQQQLKHDPGGLLDIEFLTQLGVLSTAATHPELNQHTEIPMQLASLADSGWLSGIQARQLSETWLDLNRQRRMLTLLRQPDCLTAPAGQSKVVSIWKQFFAQAQ